MCTVVSSIQSASGWNAYSISGALMPQLLLWSVRHNGVDPVGPQRHAVGGLRGGPAQRRFERHRTAFDARFVADLDVPARHAGVAAHGAAVLFRGLVILQHRLDHEGGKVAPLGVGARRSPAR